MPHVNAASELEKLFRARLQAFPDPQTGGELSLYLTDYEVGKFELRPGEASWDGEIVPPKTILEYLGREDWRRKQREKDGPWSPACDKGVEATSRKSLMPPYMNMVQSGF